MMDDWLGIRPHHKFVPQYTQATKKPKEMGATGSFNLSCTGLLAPASPQLSARPHPICSDFLLLAALVPQKQSSTEVLFP